MRDVLGTHAFSDFPEIVAGSDGGWSGSHYLTGRARVLGVEAVEVFKSAGDYSEVVDYDTRSDLWAQSTTDVADPVPEIASRNVRVDSTEDSRLGWAGTVGGPSCCDPVDLAGGVVIDPLEAELFEPTRGSGAHVSKGVPAVDGNWL